MERVNDSLSPLLVLSAFSVSMYLARLITTGSERFSFLNWNLAVAWLPLVCVWALVRQLRIGRWWSWQALLLATLWLIFLPNSFYLVTDFVHLEEPVGVSLLFDTVMLMSFALSGLSLGLSSVYLMHRLLLRRLGQRNVWLILQACFLLSGFAIYLGRNLGWNSWDLLLYPANILLDVGERLVNPTRYISAFTTTLLFYIFLSVTYEAFSAGIKAIKQTK